MFAVQGFVLDFKVKTFLAMWAANKWGLEEFKLFLANAEHKERKWSQAQNWSNLKCFIPGVWRSRVCGCGGEMLTAINVLNNGGTKKD